MFGIGAAISGYAQMIFGSEVANSGIKRTQFKPVYIPTWVIDSVVSFNSRVGETEQGTSLHLRETTLPGIHHHPLALWSKIFPDTMETAKPFSKEHLEPLDGKHDILTLPYTTSPLAIPQALSQLSYRNLEISEDWSVDPKSVEFKMLVAYPLLQPVYLSEFTLEDRHLTILAHGNYEYFSIWGHPKHPDTWVDSGPSVNIAYLRTTQQLNGGPHAMINFLEENTTPSNLEKIAGEVDMNDLRIQSLSVADATRNWMQLAAKADGMKFIIENIPANTNARVIEVGPGARILKSNVETDARAPLKEQLKELEAEMKASKPDWLAKWDESNRETETSEVEKPAT
ncbi:hypothetical protein FRC09_018211 [Ceratobasidium sp. 395]|nr:hypothetical protein FRC09_018211 [Ceratobasidium sp. 395]